MGLSDGKQSALPVDTDHGPPDSPYILDGDRWKGLAGSDKSVSIAGADHITSDVKNVHHINISLNAGNGGSNFGESGGGGYGGLNNLNGNLIKMIANGEIQVITPSVTIITNTIQEKKKQVSSMEKRKKQEK